MRIFRNVYKKRRVKPPQIVVDMYTIVEIEKGKVKIESFYDLLRVEELVPRIKDILIKYIFEYLLNRTTELTDKRSYKFLQMLDYLDLARGAETCRSLIHAVPIYRRRLIWDLTADVCRDLEEVYLIDSLRDALLSFIVAALRRKHETLMRFLKMLLKYYEVYMIYNIRDGEYKRVEREGDLIELVTELAKRDLPCVLIPRATSTHVKSHEIFKIFNRLYEMFKMLYIALLET